jgi:hypothetical protein
LSEPSRLYEESAELKVTVRPGKALEEFSARALADPEKFWGEQAKNLAWHKQWDRVL